MAAAIYSEPASWQKIRGLQISGKVAVVSEEKTAKTSFLKKYPFASLFLAKSRVIDPLIKEKTEGVNFYCFRPAHITLIDNSIKFGFHHTVSLEE